MIKDRVNIRVRIEVKVRGGTRRTLKMLNLNGKIFNFYLKFKHLNVRLDVVVGQRSCG